MIKVDLHCHSTHSKHPSEWFLQRIGAQESYTPVEEVYRLAKARGMTYVTLTDHNTIDGALEMVASHPDDTFIGVEVTTYFPEDGCKIHVLVWGITPEQFDRIQSVRASIYELRDFLRRNAIACSVAHATFNINGRLTIEHLEKLILLFNVFEGVNGARSEMYNQTWARTLQHLKPSDVDRLRLKHAIEPWGDKPWVKGLTGGSDDHAGLLIGKTFTLAPDASAHDFLDSIRRRETVADGRHGDHKTLAFAIYKIAYDLSRHKTGGSGVGFWNILNTMLFEDGRLDMKHRIAVRRLKRSKESRDQIITRFFEALADSRQNGDTDALIDGVYNSLAGLSDDFFSMIATSVEKDLKSGDTPRLVKNSLAALPAVFLSAPFFSAMKHQHRARSLARALEHRFGAAHERDHRVLWFSDTVLDLNGVSVTVRALADAAHRTGRPLKIVTSIPEEDVTPELPVNMINLPCIYTLTPEFYTAFTLRVPSLLRAIDMIANENPDEIVISTPGPVGLLGLVAGRLMDIKCSGIYHTDFTRQVDLFIGDESVSNLVEAYTRGFFRMLDEVRVPTGEYIRILADRGLDPSRMQIFKRGIESSFPVKDPEKQLQLRAAHNLNGGATLVWAGRLGKEKNLDGLIEIYRDVARRRPDTNLLIVGDGPEKPHLAERTRDLPNVRFLGRLPREELPHVYGVSDVLVFPSTTDTFGMVVLEAQACGTPALVTDVGGPQEIVSDGETGHVLPAHDKAAWVSRIVELLDLKKRDPGAFHDYRESIRHHFATCFSWEHVLDSVLGPQPAPRRSIRLPGKPLAAVAMTA